MFSSSSFKNCAYVYDQVFSIINNHFQERSILWVCVARNDDLLLTIILVGVWKALILNHDFEKKPA